MPQEPLQTMHTQLTSHQSDISPCAIMRISYYISGTCPTANCYIFLRHDYFFATFYQISKHLLFSIIILKLGENALDIIFSYVIYPNPIPISGLKDMHCTNCLTAKELFKNCSF